MSERTEQRRPMPDGDGWIDEVLREHARLGPLLPEVDPDELLNILYAVMRPFGSNRRFLLRKGPGEGYVF
jgi:hypothetical protein